MSGTAAVAAAVILLHTGAQFRAVRPPSKPLSVTRSFEITDKPIVSSPSFTLDRVLSQLIARSGAHGVTPQQLLRQMFDTQNPRPGLAELNAPHCDDTVLNGQPSFNGFPLRCPTPEGKLAATPYTNDEWFTIGIANRFDLTPADGSNCGQYRIAFAHREANPGLVQLHLIFEAVLPNPNRAAGIAGCRPVAQFWSDLSSIDSMDIRRQRIETFFFEGLDGFAPVVDPPNYASPGGIRTLQQTLPAPGDRFYQFRLASSCSSGDCTLRFVPDVLENMPFGPLFNDNTPQARAFRDDFLKQVPSLAVDDLLLFSMHVPDQYLMAEVNPTDKTPFPFSYGLFETPAYMAAIQTELTRIGSKLTPDQIITRVSHEGCIGCHGFNGAVNLGGNAKLVVGFQGLPMISDSIFTDGEAGPQTRYGVDPIVEKQFVPHRMQILQEFLRNGTPPVHSK
jgi:hypothetical protein